MNEFIMLVGPAGSGKSTVANNLRSEDNNYVIVSSDSIRYELFGDESVQGNPAEIFAICRSRCANLLSIGHSVIFDATNLNRKKRKSFLNDVKSRAGVEFTKHCIVVAVTYEDCCVQNKNRQRTVPDFVIRRHFNEFQMPLYSEGWDKITVVQRSNITLDSILDKCRGLAHDNHHHKYDVYEHCKQTQSWISSNVDPLSEHYGILLHLALWHDVGKFYTKVFTDKKGNPTEEAHFYCHENWSCMYNLCDDYYTGDFKIKLAQLISLHMMKYQPEYGRFIEKWAPEYKDILDIFNRADAESA